MQKTVTHPLAGAVTLSRTRRSTRVKLSINADGAVRLSFPTWVSERRALRFLDEKCDWIVAARESRNIVLQNIPSGAQKAAEKRAIEALRAEAKAKLPDVVARLAQKHGLRHGAIRIKASKSRWGSCNGRGDINLSLFLVKLPEHLTEYIILHELCHTVHHNHSAHFHALLDRVTDGRSKALGKELKSYKPSV